LRHAVGAGEEQSWSPPVRLRKTFLALLVALPAAALVLGANRSLRLYAANVYWAGGLRAKDAGRLPQAIDRYSRALELTPEQHELFFLRGSVLAGMSEAESDPARSKELARRGLSDLHRAARGFSDVTLFANLGKLHADLGDHETSLEWHRREAGTGLNYAAAHTKVGVELLALGRLDEAAVELEEALEVQPDLDWARFHLGMVRWRQGRHEEAADCFRRYLFRNPDSVEGHNNLGLMLMETGRLAEAVQAFETALRAEPDNVPVLNNLGAAHFRMGRVDLARRRWARALEIDPGNEIARENLSRWGDAGR
jgi:tetratricopeptide (TPR) repeat protein